MNSSFFPAQEPAPEPEQHVVPPWLQHPDDEYPARILVREFLDRTGGTSLAVSHLDVFSTGLLIKVEWDVRRLEESAIEWQVATGMGHFYGGNDEEGSERRFGLALADGTVVTTVDRRRLHEAYTQEPQGWSLVDRGGGGGGGENRYSGSSELWLWPLPPRGPIELVGEWRARGIPESRVVLDGDAVLAAVNDVQPLWLER